MRIKKPEELNVKKFVVVLLLFSLPFSSGCGKKETQPEHNPADYRSNINVIEETYVEILNTITANPTNFVDSTINIEGMFMTDPDGKTYVYRNGPECCYPENTPCGFEFEKGDTSIEEGEWIKVSGTLSYYTENSYIRLILKDCTVTKPETRGKETVEHVHQEPLEIVE